MIRRFLLAGLIALLIATVFGSGLAAPAHPQSQKSQGDRGKRMKWWTNETVQQKLELSEEQIASIAELNEAVAADRSEATRSQRKAYHRMITGLADENLSNTEFLRRREDLERIWLHRAQMTIDYWLQLRSLLSTDQWQQLPSVAPRALQFGDTFIRGYGRVTIGGDEAGPN